mmetsp:Transcript_57768/g.146601  ORF Transcript_57768/g.146601 Transcript_57768/m.146601 type:complete len:422 (+) Transcript_57768:136-1401(+)
MSTAKLSSRKVVLQRAVQTFTPNGPADKRQGTPYNRRSRNLFLGLHHSILQEASSHCPVVSLQAIRVPHESQEGLWSLEGHLDPIPWRPDADPNRVPPRRQGLLGPVVGGDRLQQTSPLHEFAILADGDEVRMAPLLVDVLQRRSLFGSERRHRVALAPSCHDQVSSRSQHPAHLLNVLLFVGHVLAGLTPPHQVEGAVLEHHVEGIRHLELDVGEAGLLGQLRRPGHLLGGERDSDDLGLRERPSQEPRCASDAATYIQDLLRRSCARPSQHLFAEFKLGLNEVLVLASQVTVSRSKKGDHEPIVLVVPLLILERRVRAHVDVLTPVVLEDALARPRVVLGPHAVAGVVRRVRAARCLQPDLHLVQAKSGQDQGNKTTCPPGAQGIRHPGDNGQGGLQAHAARLPSWRLAAAGERGCRCR